ncbi:hypothetical protein XBO1_2520001 [Xenorhabdus bovienii str. oregonense]|uniref:Uncharacterized protein n=1 Tax=Xenorhabdus bovienii str. oregonense TaxID=1398202 RepID=A0A077P7A2_XENBV|nr:hypothetical protein [Xenorhabdus bovienii]CDH07030.1 hypothetical protein XBO1_2520001 [Xenorhabdus bovienii str. oregonense]
MTFPLSDSGSTPEHRFCGGDNLISVFKQRINKLFFPEKISIRHIENKNTLVLWEGVTYFLPDEIILSTIIELRELFKGKLQVTLDYAFRDYIEGDLNFYGAKELYNVLVEISEPHFFGLNFNESEKYFANLGFKTTENLTALMLESKYLRNGFGKSAGLSHVFNAMTDIVRGE